MTILINPTVDWHIYDLYKLSPGPLAGAPRWEILRVTSDPDRIHTKVVSHFSQEAHGPCGVPVTSMLRLNEVAYVTGVPLDMHATIEPQVDASDLLSRTGVQHAEEARLAFVDRMRTDRRQLKLQIIAEHG